MKTNSWTLLLLLLLLLRGQAEKYHLLDMAGKTVTIELDPHHPQLVEQLHLACQQSMSPSFVHECKRTIACHVLAHDNSTAALCTERYETNMHNDILHHPNPHRSHPRYKYSSHTCLGGAQRLNQAHLRTSNHRHKFHNTNDPAFHVCKFHNVCLLYGTYPTFLYLTDPMAKERLPEDFQLEYLESDRQLQLGYFSEFYSSQRNKPFMPILFVNESLPESAFVHADDTRIAFLAAHSWPNYGHILFDNFIASFTAAQMYHIAFDKIQLLFDSECLKFAGVNPLGPSPSMPGATNQMECLQHIRDLDNYLLDHPHIFLDDHRSTGVRICYRTLIAGHSSAYGQKAWDLSRELSLRTFRDYVVNRFQRQGLFTSSSSPQNGSQAEEPQLEEEEAAAADNLIVVLLRGDGLTMTTEHKDNLNDLMCNGTKEALQWLGLQQQYRVECQYPQHMSLPQEVHLAQRAKILVSFHGTVSYTSLFVRDNTQVIIITEDRPNQFGKDYHIYSRLTYFNTLWLSFEQFHDKFVSILEHAIRLQHV